MSDLVIEAIAAVGVASATLVTVELTDGRGDPIVGYVDGTDNVIVLPTTVTTDENGEVTIDLIPNANIVPGNSCYTVRIAHKQFLIQKSSVSQTLLEALVNDPGDLDPINTDFLLRANNLSDLEDVAVARDNLELGNSATLDVGTTAGTVAAGDDPRFEIAPDHIADTVDAHDATAISFSPTVSIPADDVQEAIEYVMDNASGGGTNDHNLLINRDAADQHPASSVTNTPAGSIAATHVQGAINELDGDIQGHIADTVDAHDASAISAVPFATIVGTDVQSQLQEVYASAVTGLDEASEISFVPTGDIVATNVQDAIVEVDGELHAHETDTVDAHDASAISFTPASGITSTDTQAAIVEALNDSIAYTDGAAVPKAGTYAATTTDVMTSKVTGDPFVRYSQDADGKNEWGDGTAAPDTNLYRSAANLLRTDDQFRANYVANDIATGASGLHRFQAAGGLTAPSSTNIVNCYFEHLLNSGSSNHTGTTSGFLVLSGTAGTYTGTLTATNAFQTQLNLVTGSTVTTARHLLVGTNQSSGTVTTGYGVQVNNQGRASTATSYGIAVDAQSGSSSANYGIAVGAATTSTLWLSSNTNSTTAAGGITFGSSADTNLYRSAADTLKTDDRFLAIGTPTASQATIHAAPVYTALGANLNAGFFNPSFTPSADEGTFATRGMFVQVDKFGTFNHTTTIGLRGGQFGVVNNGSGNITGASAFIATVQNVSTGTITNAVAAHLLTPTAAAGNPITNAYGVLVEPQSATAVTNGFGVAIGASTTSTLWVSNNTNSTAATGGIHFGSSRDTNLYRSAADILKTDDKFVTVAGLGVGNSVAATTPGSVTRKIEVFDASGASLGFIPVYSTIT